MAPLLPCGFLKIIFQAQHHADMGGVDDGLGLHNIDTCWHIETRDDGNLAQGLRQFIHIGGGSLIPYAKRAHAFDVILEMAFETGADPPKACYLTLLVGRYYPIVAIIVLNCRANLVCFLSESNGQLNLWITNQKPISSILI